MIAVLDSWRRPVCTGDRPVAPTHPGRPQIAPDPDYIGCVIAEQRGVKGPISLEVLLSDGPAIEIGPFRLERHQAASLQRLLALTVALLSGHAPSGAASAPAPESGRGIAGWDLAAGLCTGDRPVAPTMAPNLNGRAHCPPWEGETLP